MTHAFHVHYQSGKEFTVFGHVLQCGRIDESDRDSWGVAILGDNDRAVFIDPRAYVACDCGCGKVVYNPREHLHNMPREFRKWLISNPDWPKRLEVAQQ